MVRQPDLQLVQRLKAHNCDRGQDANTEESKSKNNVSNVDLVEGRFPAFCINLQMGEESVNAINFLYSAIHVFDAWFVELCQVSCHNLYLLTHRVLVTVWPDLAKFRHFG